MNDNTQQQDTQQQALYKIQRSELPLHCPLDSMSLWNTHPRVYLPIEATGKAVCPYCGTKYELID